MLKDKRWSGQELNLQTYQTGTHTLALGFQTSLPDSMHLPQVLLPCYVCLPAEQDTRQVARMSWDLTREALFRKLNL